MSTHDRAPDTGESPRAGAGAPGPGWTYRPALDGVRTIAVYLVVAFHAGVSALDGGFVGVDLFFVLSGFLVGGILLDEAARTGRVDLRRFYARRVRRLLPAALVAVVGTAAVFVLVAPLARRIPLVGDGQAALLYVANWRFVGQSNDYFRTDVDRSPFLHFWSLSIEEQFYVAFPLLLVVLVRLGRRWRPAVPVGVAVVLVASLVSQVHRAAHDPDWAYYGTDARVYQLLAGVAAAWWWQRLRQRSAVSRHRRGGVDRFGVLTTAGLIGLVVVSLGAVDVTPSVRGMLATVVSVALVLGIAGNGRQPIARLLARSTPVYLGRISYGTYLWHWPVVLVLLVLLDTGPWALLGLTAVLATGLAALSFHVLEHPVRVSRALAPYRLTTVCVGLTASAVVALAVLPPLLRDDARPALAQSPRPLDSGQGQPVPDDIDYAAYLEDRGPGNVFCTFARPDACVVHEGGSGLKVALVGDSQARMIEPMLADLAEQHDFTLSLYIVSGCPWQTGVVNTLFDPDELARCRRARDDLYGGLLEQSEVDVVVLAQLERDSEGWLEKLQPAEGERTTRSEAELAEITLSTMQRTLGSIRRAGVRSVVLESIITVPLTQPAPLDCLSAARSTDECLVPAPPAWPVSDAFIRTFATQSPDVASFSLNGVMCPDSPVCQPLQGGLPVWRDPEHYAPRVVQSHGDEVWDMLTATGFFGT